MLRHSERVLCTPSFRASAPCSVIPSESSMLCHSQRVNHTPSFPASRTCSFIPSESSMLHHSQRVVHAPSFRATRPCSVIPIWSSVLRHSEQVVLDEKFQDAEGDGEYTEMLQGGRRTANEGSHSCLHYEFLQMQKIPTRISLHFIF